MKHRPNHRIYVQTLRRMTPEQRLGKALELSSFTRALFRQGLRERHPELSESELEALYRARVEKARNRVA